MINSLKVALAGFVLTSFAFTDLLGQSVQSSTKKPWEWTPAERAAARRDPAKKLERVRADKRPAGAALPADVIDGTQHPELFFETELFEMLVRSAFVLLPNVYPMALKQRSSDLFQKPGEWERFSAIVHDYAEVLRREKSAADALDRPGASGLADAKCAAGAKALRDARREFGRERVDRMLYETVTVKRVYSLDTDFETSIGRALHREERCQ